MKGICVSTVVLFAATSIAASQARAQQQQIPTGCAQIVAVRGRDEGAASAETLYDDASPIEEDDGEAQ